MKKILAMVLALTLIALSVAALAEPVKLTENASGFDLTIDLPEGAAVKVETNDDVPYTFITFADASMPKVYISVAATEEYDPDETLASLSKDDLDTLFTTVSEDFDKPSYKLKKTTGGNDYMLVEDDSATDSALLLMLYKGYFIQMTIWNEDYAVLTDAQTKAAEALLDTVKIVDVAT